MLNLCLWANQKCFLFTKRTAIPQFSIDVLY
nr:MAG TPA: hypothetical protein [Caudoviricetes sp.]